MRDNNKYNIYRALTSVVPTLLISIGVIDPEGPEKITKLR